ncbi:hypothetical protein NXX40_23660 [Parabacteroides distasonis]|nr:hypothetical protein [Parabacteroides distasonis]
MIRHLLQLIWNQRKQNAWLWAELLLVSVFLWFLVDYLYVMGRTYTAPLGLRYPAYVQHRDQQPLGKKPGLYPEGEAGAAGWCSSADGVGSHPHLSRRGIGLPYGWGDALLYGKP